MALYAVMFLFACSSALNTFETFHSRPCNCCANGNVLNKVESKIDFMVSRVKI